MVRARTTSWTHNQTCCTADRFYIHIFFLYTLTYNFVLYSWYLKAKISHRRIPLWINFVPSMMASSMLTTLMVRTRSMDLIFFASGCHDRFIPLYSFPAFRTGEVLDSRWTWRLSKHRCGARGSGFQVDQYNRFPQVSWFSIWFRFYAKSFYIKKACEKKVEEFNERNQTSFQAPN